ncbi:uncharacterized protein LOC110934240 [Helianthus annuus]|uniref:uncharacterized protein LOC110934240 n=1 Tax=Helianthus annuus TaxID=4232 RepID=UPI000B9023CF|nr:uncharacterized protein LOC110934240 [Helianthus annuus]
MVDLSLSITLDAIRNKSVKTTDEGKRKREEESSHRSDKKKKGNSKHKKNFEFKKNSSQSDKDPNAVTAESVILENTKSHKTLECKELKNATCYNCNEEGHIKTNSPKLAKKPEEAKKTNARVFQMNAQEAVHNDNVITVGVGDQVSSMTNSDKTTVNRVIDGATHANDATIVNLKINRDVLQAMIDAAVGKAIRKVMKKFKEPNATFSKSHLKPHFITHEKDLIHASSAKNEPKRKREKDNSKTSKKKGKLELNKNQQKSNKKLVCKTCYKRHWGQCRMEQRPRPCGICKSTSHPSHECRDIKNAVCFGCGEKGHIKTTCPKSVKGCMVKNKKPKNESA